MNNIAVSKGLQNLPKKELNAIGADLGLGSLKKHEMIHSISAKLINMILSANQLEIQSHPAVDNNPIIKEILKGFFDSLTGTTNLYASSSSQQ